MSEIKILVVDDEPDILEFLSYNLLKEGYQVSLASNGEEGLRKAEAERPDLILLDIMMPQVDGVEVCRTLRGQSHFENTLIAFLTARDEDFSQIAAFEAGGDDFITKPIKPRVLMSRIKALLRRKEVPDAGKNGEQGSLQIGDLLIDKVRIKVSRGEEVIELAKKEFELLWLLANRPGKVFSREEIFSKIWGADVIVGNRTIDVHIRKLREKLGDNYIKTLKGYGYRFEF